MSGYTITHARAGAPERETHRRRRRDSAWLLFNRTVDAMVRDHAALDTDHGIRAQLAARGAEVPSPGGDPVVIRHQGASVTLATA